MKIVRSQGVQAEGHVNNTLILNSRLFLEQSSLAIATYSSFCILSAERCDLTTVTCPWRTGTLVDNRFGFNIIVFFCPKFIVKRRMNFHLRR